MPRATWLRSAVLAVSLLFAAAGGLCAATLGQTGTMESLAAGDYAGRASCAAVLRQGDFGLGTFDGLNGEMAILDGVIYQITSDGVVHRAKPGQTTPFVQAARFAGSLDLGRVDGLDLPGLTAALAARLPDPARLYAVRVDGAFAALTVRSVPAQSRPWPSLAEAIKGQKTYPLAAVQGTLVGFYTPPGLPALSPPGWHFHFLSADRRQGGHVLALTLGPAKARGDAVDGLDIVYPKDPLPRRDVAAPAPGTE